MLGHWSSILSTRKSGFTFTSIYFLYVVWGLKKFPCYSAETSSPCLQKVSRKTFLTKWLHQPCSWRDSVILNTKLSGKCVYSEQRLTTAPCFQKLNILWYFVGYFLKKLRRGQAKKKTYVHDFLNKPLFNARMYKSKIIAWNNKLLILARFG